MMEIDIVRLPTDLKPHHLKNRAVVVFDVLRATTSIVTAIASGAREVQIYGSLDAARLAAADFDGARLLAGEQKCLRPDGFDLGNSPGDFTSDPVAGKTIFLSTTNGTRAIVAAQGAARLFAAALVNATATAKYVERLGLDVTLLCSGTNGVEAPEDLTGASTVEFLLQFPSFDWDYPTERLQLAHEFRQTDGGRNIIDAGLIGDIDFAAQLDQFDTVVEITGLPPVARKCNQ
jgi:2-phosphosulfolactate phosphatase